MRQFIMRWIWRLGFAWGRLSLFRDLASAGRQSGRNDEEERFEDAGWYSGRWGIDTPEVHQRRQAEARRRAEALLVVEVREAEEREAAERAAAERKQRNRKPARP